MEEGVVLKGRSSKTEMLRHLTAASVWRITYISNVVGTEKSDGPDSLDQTLTQRAVWIFDR